MSEQKKDDGKKAKDLMDSLRGCFDEAKAKIQEIENKKKLERQRRKKVKDDYNKWLEEQRPEAEKAAQIILEWVKDFLASKMWEEITSSLRSLKMGNEGDEELIINHLSISRTVIYDGPSPNPYHPHGKQGYQSFFIDLAGSLFVHEDVKYGKSYKLKSIEEMMRYVDLVVLVEVAKTMQDDSIWDIIKEKLAERLKKAVPKFDDLLDL